MFLLVIFPFQNNFLINYFFSLFVGFIFGSIPFGYLIAKLKGIDIRQYGSKNIGFNNVRRVVGLKYAIPVLILDIAKGLLPVVFAAQFEAIPIMVGLGAILGHSFTPWLGFKGGKGVATTIGVILALIPWSLVVGIVVFIIVALLFAYVSLASMALAISLPISVALLYPQEKLILIITIAIALLIILRHRDNIKRIINGTEPKINRAKFFRLSK